MTDLDDILNDDKPDEVIPPVEEAKTEEAPADVTDDKQQDSPSESEDKSTSEESSEPKGETTESDDQKMVPLAALEDERSKRKYWQGLAEKNVDQTEEEKAPERPSIFEDEQGALDAIQRSSQEGLAALRLEMSQELMRSQKTDYDEKEQAFIALANDNKQLYQEMYASKNPARFVYETAEKHAQLKELENVDDYRAKIRAEVEQELRKEIEGEQKTQKAKTDNITQSLAKESSQGSIQGAAWTGPTPLDSIFNN